MVFQVSNLQLTVIFAVQLKLSTTGLRVLLSTVSRTISCFTRKPLNFSLT